MRFHDLILTSRLAAAVLFVSCSLAFLSISSPSYDFDLDLLYPLRTLSIGSVPMSVPFDSESLLKLRYPHSYGWSLPYNPRCWWSALTTGLPDVGAINVTTPPHVDEVWGNTRETSPGEEPPRFVWSPERVEFVDNDEWTAWHLKHQNGTVVATTS